ncbi:MAG: flagellar hook-associated protein FlgL [Pseudomonadota bacterium]
MRISTAQLYDQSVASLGRLSSETVETQQQLATGQRLLSAKDDPAAAGRISRLTSELEQRERYIANADRAEELLEQEETVLDQIVESLLRVRELTLQAGDGALTPADRSFLGTELGVRFDELVSLLNSRNAEGTYLFSGLKEGVEPFAFDANGLNYRGDFGQRELAIGDGQRVAISDSGAEVFTRLMSPLPQLEISPGVAGMERIAVAQTVSDPDRLASAAGQRLQLSFAESVDGLTMTLADVETGQVIDGIDAQRYSPELFIPSIGSSVTLQSDPGAGDALFIEVSPDRDLLSLVADITLALESEDSPINQNFEALEGTIANVLDGLESAVDQIVDTRASIGARLNSLDDSRNLNTDLVLQGQGTLSSLRDVDFAAAVSNLQYQSFLLEAAQQSYIRLSRISLFNNL